VKGPGDLWKIPSQSRDGRLVECRRGTSGGAPLAGMAVLSQVLKTSTPALDTMIHRPQKHENLDPGRLLNALPNMRCFYLTSAGNAQHAAFRQQSKALFRGLHSQGEFHSHNYEPCSGEAGLLRRLLRLTSGRGLCSQVKVQGQNDHCVKAELTHAFSNFSFSSTSLSSISHASSSERVPFFLPSFSFFSRSLICFLISFAFVGPAALTSILLPKPS